MYTCYSIKYSRYFWKSTDRLLISGISEAKGSTLRMILMHNCTYCVFTLWGSNLDTHVYEETFVVDNNKPQIFLKHHHLSNMHSHITEDFFLKFY